jgi:hypothetical protein
MSSHSSDRQYAAEVNIIISPPQTDPYTTLRAELIYQLSPSREHRILHFLTSEMGGHEQSKFLRYLRNLVPDVPDDFLCNIW